MRRHINDLNDVRSSHSIAYRNDIVIITVQHKTYQTQKQCRYVLIIVL